MKDTKDYITLEGNEIKALREIAKEENKSVQELFVKAIEEFIAKNIEKLQESKK